MVKIVTDSSCDLEKEILEFYSIHVVPLPDILFGKDCRDGIDLGINETYRLREIHKTISGTVVASRCGTKTINIQYALHGGEQI